ncbi:serine/threonine-protein kinase [Streptomyces sp. HSW2009]|uniref:serine/threonine-protein kinase n=1 Tax=Streptomyces sp. HSW2009 TaxID=3142890 RepID=UPI0032EC1A6E
MRRGERVGKYKLTDGPVEGGQGAVWFAFDTELGRNVVLKHARPESDDSGSFDELLREARALARFSHPHVVTLYDVIRTNKNKRATLWLVMEHVTGGSLDIAVKLTQPHTAGIGAQIADALAALHASGLVHCDVKPGNIVITKNHVAKLADFGAAHRMDSSATITPNGPISLTPSYAAPEAFRGAPEAASDVFSLGATLYSLATGTPPLRTATQAVRLDAVASTSGTLGPLLTAMMQTDPRARPTADFVHRALADLAGEAGSLATLPLKRITVSYPTPLPPSAAPTIREQVTTFVNGNRLLTAGVATVAALAVATPLVLLNLSDDGEPAGRSGPAASKPNRSAPAFLGEQKTADPCSLVQAKGFPAYDSAEPDQYQGNFNRCDVLLQVDKEDVVDVRVELDDDDLPEGTKQRTDGRVTIAEPEPESDECVRAMTVTGVSGTSLRVTAAARKPKKLRQDLCDTADIATAYTVSRLNEGGQVKRRGGVFPQNSLAHKDACTMLDMSALAKVSGIDAQDPKAGYGQWSCQWESTVTNLEIDLQFQQGGMPQNKKTTRTKLGGRAAVVQPESRGPGSCRVEVVNRIYLGPGREHGTERVAVVVHGTEATGQACEVAKDLATSAVQFLPGPVQEK